MIIYLITNLNNGKKYVGQTSLTVEERWQDHVYNANSSSKRSEYPLYCAIRKYGVNSFKLEILDQAENQDDLNEKEIKYIAFYGTMFKEFGYNRHEGGNKPPLSTPESRKKAGLTIRGQKRSLETRQKMSLSAKGYQHFLGKRHSEETKIKIGNTHKTLIAEKGHGHRAGQKSSLEHCAKIAAALTGKKHSEESKMKMRLAKLNPSPEIRQKLRDAHLGKPWSARRRQAWLNKKNSTTSPLV